MFNLVLNETKDKLGMKMTSMVGEPAIMVDWVQFSKDSPIQLSVQNEEQRIVFGPVLIPDLPIKRSANGQIFFVKIDRENIQKTAIKFHRDGLATKLDTNHNGQLLQGITIFESFSTDENRVLSVKGYESLPVGTLFFTAKVNNDQVWADIKAGKINGYSIDAAFEFELAENPDTKAIDNEIQEILNTL